MANIDKNKRQVTIFQSSVECVEPKTTDLKQARPNRLQAS